MRWRMGVARRDKHENRGDDVATPRNFGTRRSEIGGESRGACFP